MTTVPVKTTDELPSATTNAEGVAVIEPTAAAPTESDSDQADAASSEPALPTQQALNTQLSEVAGIPDTGDAAPPQPEPQANPEQALTEPAPVEEAGTASEKPAADAGDTSATRADFDRLGGELEKLGGKATAKIQTLRSSFERLRKTVGDDDAELSAAAEAVGKTLDGLWKMNQEHQRQLHKNSVELLAKLRQALADGQSNEALSGWDRLQSNISNTSGAIKAELSQACADLKAPITELRDWKTFASTEKKKQLIEEMTTLVASETAPPERAKRISAMHKQWKELGHSNDNEQLWQEFKKHSDAAYEPCKAYFKERKALMAENLKQRREISQRLEQEVAALDESALNIAAVNKLIADFDKQWKQYAPVEPAKIKPLQKQFYGHINSLRKLRRRAIKGNADEKKALIERARQLTEAEDNRTAMEEAKALQKQWKSIGPTSFKEDKKYWDDFRAACDAIFAVRNEVAAKRRAEFEQTEKSLKELLGALEKLAELDDDSLRNERSRYQELSRSFSEALDPRLKKKSTYLDSFNKIKRRLDMRYKSLPDKRTLKLREELKARLQPLQALEQSLFEAAAADTGSSLTGLLDSADRQAIESAPALPDQTLEDILKKRWQALRSLGSATDLEKLVAAASDTLRRDCIALEIRANADTPEADQALRMEIQLAQLKSAFGQAKPDRQGNAKYARELLLKAECYGPIPESQRQALLERMKAAAERLV